MRFSTVSLLLVALCSMLLSAQDQDHPSVVTLRNQPPLTNRDVITMVKSNLSDAIIVKTIQANRTEFDVSAQGVLRLQSSGVSQGVIDAMLSVSTGNRRSQAITVETSSDPPAPVEDSAPGNTPEKPRTGNPVIPDDVGVFLMQHEKLVTIEPEIVNWRSGGVLKQTATLGIDKGHVNGTVPRQHSGLSVSWPHQGGPLEFYIRCQEGNSASEYQLLRLWDKGDRREFRAVTGGVLHRSGGAQKNEVKFDFEKVAPRTYRIPFSSLEPGEYGFLAPGAVGSSNAASLGKIYTFRVTD